MPNLTCINNKPNHIKCTNVSNITNKFKNQKQNYTKVGPNGKKFKKKKKKTKDMDEYDEGSSSINEEGFDKNNDELFQLQLENAMDEGHLGWKISFSWVLIHFHFIFRVIFTFYLSLSSCWKKMMR